MISIRRACSLSGLLANLLVLVVSCSDNDPTLPVPRPPVWPSGDLLDVAAPALDRVVVLSDTGQIFVSHDGGATFDTAHIPASGPLRRLSMGTPQVGWAVGPGVLLRTDDGGDHWRHLRGPRRASELDLLDVAAIDDQRAVVIGADGLRMHTIDGGSVWQDVSSRSELPGETPEQWTAIFCLRRSSGGQPDTDAPAGQAAAPASGSCWVAGDEIRYSPDGGATWQALERRAPFSFAPFGFDPGQVELSNDDAMRIRDTLERQPAGLDFSWQIDVRVSGEEIDRIALDGDPHALFDLIEARGGELRALLEAEGLATERIEVMGAPPWGYAEFLDDDSDFLERYWVSRRSSSPHVRLRVVESLSLASLVVGPDGDGWGGGLAGRGLMSTHADSGWQPFEIPGAHDLLDVRPNQGRVIAVGRQGGLWVREEARSGWQPVLPEGVPPFSEALNAIAFDPSGRTGYIVGERGRVFLSRDAGASWEVLSGTGKSSAALDSRESASVPITRTSISTS